jgi:hypothetical protein
MNSISIPGATITLPKENSDEALAVLALKMHSVLSALRVAVADHQHPHNRYMYATYDTVAAAVREALMEAGLAHTVGIDAITQEDTGTTTGRGTPIFRTTVHVAVSLIDTQSGAIWTARAVGQHLGSDDKSPQAALTAALKYHWLRSMLLISAETDPEETTEAPAPRPARAAAPKANGNGNGNGRPGPSAEADPDDEELLQYLTQQARNAGVTLSDPARSLAEIHKEARDHGIDNLKSAVGRYVFRLKQEMAA